VSRRADDERARERVRRALADAADEVLGERAGDDRDDGWGERPSEADPADVRRFLEAKPPHHG
jgi:hypothetical protein